eukprot:gene3287-57730_t
MGRLMSYPHHAVVVPCYLDPADVLRACLDSLRAQDDPSRLCVVARTPELDAKRRLVDGEFGDCFGELLVVVHHLDPANFALRHAYDHVRAITERDALNLSVDGSAPRTAWTVTTCDTDSLFHSCYFSTLEAEYNSENPDLDAQPQMVVWQPPLFYNWDLDKRPFFNRVTGLMRSMMMLGGLISFNLNPMSVFSYPLELGVRWMCATDSAVPVRLLPEWYEWGRQIRRWIGKALARHDMAAKEGISAPVITDARHHAEGHDIADVESVASPQPTITTQGRETITTAC